MNSIKICAFLTGVLGFTATTNAQLLVPKFENPVSIETINSDAEEVAPISYLDGDKLYFVRTYVQGNAKERKKGQEIWSSEREEGVWSEPTSIFDEANDRGNNGVIGSSRDGKKIYVFNSIQSRRKLARGVAYTEKQEDGTWGDLKKLEIEDFDIGEGYYSFHMNRSEDALLISMAANDTTVNEDLFVSLKKNEKWSAPISLGNQINTNGYEISPYLAEDGKTLYFASNGHEGLGDADIFVSYREGDSWTNWSKPLNLGTPINSSSFDAYFVIGNNQEVFFSSNRNMNYSDIYTTKISDNVSVKQNQGIAVNGQFNYNGLPAENVKLEIYDSEGNLIDEVVTDAYGRFTFNKLGTDDSYLVKIKEEDKSEYPDAKVYLLDKEENKFKRLNMISSGLYTAEPVDKDDSDVINGLYEYNKLPMSNAPILVLDDLGNVVDTIYTDVDGRFSYNKLNPEANYSFRPLNMEGLDEDELVLLGGPRHKKIQGVYKYNKLPVAKSGLVILDENGFPLDTFYTDKEGKFEYLKLTSDKDFTLVPLDTDDVLLENIDLYLTDGNGNRLDKKILKTDTKLASNQKPDKKDPSPTKKEPAKKEPLAMMDGDKVYIYFNFNEYILTKDDEEKLDKAYGTLKADQTKKVTLIGHTDNVGSAANNMKVAKWRAEAAKKYLEKKGVAASRISIEAHGESKPVAPNESDEGRAKNRRVEVKLR